MFTRFNSIVRSNAFSIGAKSYHFNPKSFYHPSSVTTTNHTTNLFVHSLRCFCSQSAHENYKLGMEQFDKAMDTYLSKSVKNFYTNPSEFLKSFGITGVKVETQAEILEILNKVGQKKQMEGLEKQFSKEVECDNPNIKESIRLFTLSANEGHAEAQYFFG